MDIKSKSKSVLFYILLTVPSSLLALTVYQGCFLWRFGPTLALFSWFFLFLLLTVATSLLLLWFGRKGKTSLPSDLSLISGMLILFWVLPPWGLSYDIIFYIFNIPAVKREIHIFVLALLPFTYMFQLSLRSTAAQLYRHTWLQNSLVVRLIRFLSKGKTLRRKLLLEILTVSLITALLTLILLTVFFGTTGNIPQLAILLVCVPIISETVLMIVFFVFRRSAGADMERISAVIAESAQGCFPTENPVSPTSPLYETGENLLELGRQTEDGIRRGVAGEKLKVELITNVSHDLRTPLTSIIGYGEQLERADLPEDTAATARALTAKAKYLSAMVNDLFDMAKTASGNVTPIRSELDLTRLIVQTLGEMDDRIQASGFQIKTDFAAAQPYIAADGMRLHRVVQNLIDNALKYSLPGTRIYLTTRNEGDSVIASILNTAGYEMAFGDMDLTERFTRGSDARTGEGSGLGLAIAKTYTEAMGGRFDVSIRGDSFEAILTFPTAIQTERKSTEIAQ